MKASILALLALSALMGLSTPSFSQGEATRTYTIDPSTSIDSSTNELEEVTKYYIHFKNISGSTIELSWQKLSFEPPPEWDYSLCDLGTCYAGIPDGEHTMFAVEKDSSGFLAPNIYPAGKSGTASIVILVWDKNNPSISDTLRWVITATAPTVVDSKKADGQQIQYYPNPTNGITNIVFETVVNGTLVFIDMNGVQQKKLSINGVAKFDADLSGLSTGQYIMQFIDRDGSIVCNKLIKK